MASELVEKLWRAEASAATLSRRGNDIARKADLPTLARLLAVHGNWDGVLMSKAFAEFERGNTMMRACIERAATASSLADLTDSIAYDAIVNAFVNSLRTISAFDAMRDSMRRVPSRARITAITAEASGIAADVIQEFEYTPLRRVELDGEGLTPKKTSALIALTTEAWSFAGATEFIQSEMAAGVASATNAQFLSDLASDAETASGTGATATHVFADLAAMLDKVALGSTSKPFLVVGPGSAKRMSVMHTSGVRAFPDLAPTGGEVCGIPTLVSSELPTDSSGHKAMLIDADSVVYDDATIELHIAEHATLRLVDTAGATGAAELISMWQQGLRGIRARRWWAVKVARPDAVVVLNQTQW
jgi:hypothetical protein